MADQDDATDLANVLASEAEDWLRKMHAEGRLLGAFFGISEGEDDKFIFLESGNKPLGQIDKVEFLRWLCRAERVIAYAYVVHRTAPDGSGSNPVLNEEVADIYASSATRDLSIAVALER